MITAKKIYNERPDIREKVMQDYPKTKREKQGCATEQSKNEAKRFERAKRYYNNEIAV